MHGQYYMDITGGYIRISRRGAVILCGNIPKVYK